MSDARRLTLLVACAVLLAAACSPGSTATSPPPAGTPSSGSPSPSVPVDPTGSADYPTGPTDVVLRYEEGGGMMLDLNLVQAPVFTLYGDGRIVFRDPSAQPPADESGLLRLAPFRTAKLSPEQIGALLTFALNDGGLGAARDRYDDPMTADGSTSTFTINAGGRTKQVSVYSLGLNPDAPDAPARAQFLTLADRLRSFDDGGAIPTDEYVPAAWRVFLLESGGVPERVAAWPWPDLTPADFPAKANEPTLPAFPARVMSADEIAALGVGDLPGGLMGYSVKAPDGKTYGVIVRPLLPDETS